MRGGDARKQRRDRHCLLAWLHQVDLLRRKFGDTGVRSVYVGLRASSSSIIDERRGRVFSGEEHNRIQLMIAEGYGAQPFSALVLDTDKPGFAATLAQLVSETQRMIAV